MTHNTDSQRSPSLRETPGEGLFAEVRAEFMRRGSTLNQWCQNEGIPYTTVRDALLGFRNGPKARAMRAKLIQATGMAQRHRMRLRVMEGRR